MLPWVLISVLIAVPIILLFLYNTISAHLNFLSGKSRKYYYQLGCGILIGLGILLAAFRIFAWEEGLGPKLSLAAISIVLLGGLALGGYDFLASGMPFTISSLQGDNPKFYYQCVCIAVMCIGVLILSVQLTIV